MSQSMNSNAGSGGKSGSEVTGQEYLAFTLGKEEYGLDEKAVALVGLRLREDLARERNAGTVRTALSVADLKE